MRCAYPLSLAVALLSAITPAVAASRFDLSCLGRMTLTAVQGAQGVPVQQAKPFVSRYRIDLIDHRWCAANCGAINPITAIDANRIVLREPATPNGGQALTLNRLTGGLTGQVVMAAPVRRLRAMGQLSAVCKVVPFSGFPARKF